MIYFDYNRLKTILESRKWSYQALANQLKEKTGFSISIMALCKLASGKTKVPKTDTSLAIAKLFGTDIDIWFIEENNG